MSRLHPSGLSGYFYRLDGYVIATFTTGAAIRPRLCIPLRFMIGMKNIGIWKCPMLLLLLFCGLRASAQERHIKGLEDEVFRLNNQLQYNQSIVLIRDFVSSTKSDADRFYGFLFLSYTYSRLLDYAAALNYLDTARAYGIKTARPDPYIDRINFEKALILFTLQEYDQAGSVMDALEQKNYRGLDEAHVAKVFVQQGYLLFRKKNYKQADAKYQAAIELIKHASPCDLPIVYAKKLELYAALKRPDMVDSTFGLAIRAADDCGIIKSKITVHQVMVGIYEKMGNYEKAYFYLKKLQALNLAYDNKTHLEQLTELDKKYQTKEKEARLLLQGKQLQRKNFLIAVLVGSFTVTAALLLLGLLLRRNKRQKGEEALRLQFTRQLLQNMEQERSRIAGELHDGISHELLTLKNSLRQGMAPMADKIDRILNDVRQISRDMHPVMLDKIGLKPSIENLCERYMQDERLFVTTDISYDKQLDANGELQLYRIIQEALTNIEKHANAHAAQITVRQHDHLLRVIIKDNGKGFDVAKTLSGSASFGLHSIIERIKALDSKADITSNETGTIIHIEIPIQHG